jgi:hypothetical protein
MSPNKQLMTLHIDMLKDKIKFEKMKLKKDSNNEFHKGRISAFELSLFMAKELKKDIK